MINNWSLTQSNTWNRKINKLKKKNEQQRKKTKTTMKRSKEDAMMDDEEKVREGYKVWRRLAVPTLYDVCASRSTVWPYSSIDFVNRDTWELKRREDGEDEYLAIGGTYTENEKKDSLQLLSIRLPKKFDNELETPRIATNKGKKDAGEDDFSEDESRSETVAMRIEKVKYKDQVMCVRSMPQRSCIMGIRNRNGGICLYNFAKNKFVPIRLGETNRPVPGDGLWWSKCSEGKFLVNSDRGEYKLFQLNNGSSLKYDGEFTKVDVEDASAVTQCDFHPTNEHIFACCSESGIIRFFDSRVSPTVASATVGNREKLLSAFAWNEFDENQVAAGVHVLGRFDNSVTLWDLRKSQAFLHLDGGVTRAQAGDPLQFGGTTQIRFKQSTLLATGGGDGRVRIHDVTNAAKPTIFIHGGHTDVCADIQWFPIEKDLAMLSCADDNILQVWRPIILRD